MPREQAPTLSRHLLNEANKYLIYPGKIARGTPRDARDERYGIDQMFSDMVIGRLTFMSNERSTPDASELGPSILDTTFCRNLLKMIPEMIQCTHALAKLALPTATDTEALVYLKESARCLLFGLSQATVALARAAVEACLREAYTQVPGNTRPAQQNPKLDSLISKLSDHFTRSKGKVGLSPEVERSAREVQRVGNDVLHSRPLDGEEALKVYEAARVVIQSVAGS